MAYNLFISTLIALSFSEIFAQYHNFKLALINDFDAECIYEKKYELMSAASVAENCLKKALATLQDRRHELESHDDERVKLVCNDKIGQKCCDKLLDVVTNCLPQQDMETVNQILHVDQAGVESLCADDAKNYRTLLASDCDTVIEMSSELKKCDLITLKYSNSIHLKDFFNEENCKIYKEFYKCKIAAAAECPSMEKALSDMFTDMFQASPCSD